MNGTELNIADYYAMEPQGSVSWIPLHFTASETMERRAETNLNGGFIFDPPLPGFLATVRANPNTFPLDMYGTKDVQFDTQLSYPPANMNIDYGQTQPIIFPDKYLHQIMDLR